MIKKLHFPRNLWEKLKKKASRILTLTPGVWLMNTIVQRFLGVNRKTPWMVHYTSRVTTSQKIHMGKEVWRSFAASGGCYIQGGNGIFIDDYTIFGPGVKIISANHDMTGIDKWSPTNPIQIGKHCWIGANAIILAGVVLGDQCIVGAGAVVTKSYPSGSVLGGVPARLLKQIETKPHK